MNTTTDRDEKLPAVRWLVLAILLVVQLQLKAILYSPAALASPIIESLRITQTDFGLIMSVINITVMSCVALGSVLVDLAGLKAALTVGLGFTTLGTGLQLNAHSLGFLLFTRLLQGLGTAISLPVLGGLLMAWFPKRERPYVNATSVAVGYLGAGIAIAGTGELLRWFHGSWRTALGCYALSLMITASIWAFIGHDGPQPKSGKPIEMALNNKARKSLSIILAMPVTWILAAGIFATSCVLVTYLSFVPLFLQKGTVALLSANRLASLLPFSGVAGVLVFGAVAAKVISHKRLLWMSSAIVLLGSIPLLWGHGSTIKIGLLITGFGLTGFIPVVITYMMALPKMTPPHLAALVVVENVAAGIAGVIAPLIVGRLSQSSIGLRKTLSLFSLVEFLAIFMFLRLPNIPEAHVPDEL